jgi:hypothetical protein
MAKWANTAFLDGGLNYLKANGVWLRLIKTYATGDNHATVVGNTVAKVALTTGSYTLSTTGTYNRKIVTATGAASATSSTTGASPDLHLAITTTTGGAAVIWVTDETSNQPITSGNTVNFPALTYTSLRPT